MPAVLAHIAVGTLAVAFYWSALLTRKGSRRHKRAGQAFLAGLAAVALSVGPLILLREDVFDPGDVVQFVYLDLCLLTAGWILFRAIRLRRDPQAFRSRAFSVLGYTLLALGLTVLAAGLAKGEPLTAFFSWIGLVLGGAMIRFVRRIGPLHPNWWLSWHLNAMALLFNAVHGTLLHVIWRWTVDPAASESAQLVFQALTVAAALAPRLSFGRRFRAPLRFWPAAPSSAPLTVSQTTKP